MGYLLCVRHCFKCCLHCLHTNLYNPHNDPLRQFLGQSPGYRRDKGGVKRLSN